MISFSVWLNWKSDRWKIVKSWSKRLTENLAFEFNIYGTHSWFMIDLKVRRKYDHQGLYLMFGILGYALDINIYDMRNEDYDENAL